MIFLSLALVALVGVALVLSVIHLFQTNKEPYYYA